MKGFGRDFGTLLIVAGIVVLVLGIYGLIIISDIHHFAGRAYDSAREYITWGGNLSGGLNFDLFVTENRFLLTIGGAACLIVGVLLRKNFA